MLWNGDVWQELERLRRNMDSLVPGLGAGRADLTYPVVNVYDDPDSVVVTAELPGMTKETVSITFADGVLTIAGRLEQPARVRTMTAVRQERSLGAFEKAVRIPTKVRQDRINALFSNGILTVTLPKSEEAKPKTITIEAK